MPPDPLVGTHAYVCVTMLSRATIILLPPCSPAPLQLKILYEPLLWINLKCGICVESALLLFVGKMHLLTGHHLSGVQCSFGYYFFSIFTCFFGTCLLAYTMVFNVNLVLCVSIDELHIKERIYWMDCSSTEQLCHYFKELSQFLLYCLYDWYANIVRPESPWTNV